MTPDSSEPVYDGVCLGIEPEPVLGRVHKKEKGRALLVPMDGEGSSISRSPKPKMGKMPASKIVPMADCGMSLLTTSSGEKKQTVQEVTMACSKEIPESHRIKSVPCSSKSALQTADGMRNESRIRKIRGSALPLQDSSKDRKRGKMRSESVHVNRHSDVVMLTGSSTTREKDHSVLAQSFLDEEECVYDLLTECLESASSDGCDDEEQGHIISLTGRESRSRSRSRSRSLSCEVTVEGLTSRGYRRKHEVKMWQQALFKGHIPDSFPGWTTRELSVLKQAVNAFMVTLEPFHVPIIVESLIDMDLFSCEEEDSISMSSSDEEETSSDEEYEPEYSVFFGLGKYVNFVKLFGFLKNAGIYSLGSKTAAQLLRVLLVALVVGCSNRLSSTKSTQHLNLNQLTHYIRQLEIARTDSWLEVASQMIA